MLHLIQKNKITLHMVLILDYEFIFRLKIDKNQKN